MNNLTILDGCYFWDAKAAATTTLGIGQPCPLIAASSGQVRDPHGNVLISRPMLEPTLDIGVLSDALKAIPSGGWVVLDAENAPSYTVSESQSHDANVKAFGKWQAYIDAVRFIRPDLKIAANLAWHSPDAEPKLQLPWSEADACTQIFKANILPKISALACETYFIDWTAPPSQGNPDTFNMWGVVGQAGWGFVAHVHAQHNWIRALTGKPAVHIFCVTPADQSRPETNAKFMSGPLMASCLDTISPYQPAAVMIWGSANNDNPYRLPDGYAIGTMTQGDWWQEIKKRAK